MNKLRYHLAALISLLLLTACSTQRNTWLSRHYQELNTRFNVYFNGNQSFEQGVTQLKNNYKDNYSNLLPMYELSNKTAAKATAGSMDKAIEKCQKAIKTHSIRVKPAKKPSSKAKQKDKDFYNQEEFNPFMDEVFMLMARAQFTKADFEGAASTCSYIIRHFSLNKKRCDEAGILQARAYTELTWYYEAENLLNDLNKATLTHSLTGDFAAAQADLNIRRKKYAEALPYLEVAASRVRRKRDKLRWNFLLGQLYQETGNRDKSARAFASVARMNPPYDMEINARIRQSEVYPGNEPKDALRKLIRMSKSPKNDEYLDQIHYAIGNLYLASGDTTKAIENFNLSLLKGGTASLQKLKTLLSLGDFYYRNEVFFRADPYYADAIPLLQKEDERYTEITRKSEILKVLSPPLKDIFTEDSLRAVAKMPEADRDKLIDKLVKAAVKKAKEEARKKREKELTEAAEKAKENKEKEDALKNPSTPEISGDKTWYFYNTSTVDRGLKEFRKKWGKRSLADDWRRLNKTSLFENQTLEKPAATDSTLKDSTSLRNDSLSVQDKTVPDSTQTGKKTAETDSNDPTKPGFYLNNLPLTEDKWKQSGEKIADGLFKSGVAFRELMENDRLALRNFKRLENEFPENKNLGDAWYYMFLIYKQQHKEIEADSARARLLRLFPDNAGAKRLERKDYIENLLEMQAVQDTLYENMYADFTAHRTDTLFSRGRFARESFPQNKHMQRMRFLEAMEYARTGHPDQFHDRLIAVRDSGAAGDLEPLVKEMLALWDAGKRPVPSAGFSSIVSVKDSLDQLSATAKDTVKINYEFKPEENHYILMVYDSTTMRPQRIQFDVALYNFTNFLLRDYELSLVKIGKMDVLLIAGFENAQDVLRYRSWIRFKDQKPEEKYPGLKIYIVSESNLKQLENGGSPETYNEFFLKKYTQIKTNP